ncbi:MAG: hypothetical protein D3904_10670 [Candidatus Electrothrix sp. EH2]|nr:hypothetical protein [Candidatus Electrothrix sp. EH2]
MKKRQIVIIKADDCTGWRANWPKFISIIKKYNIKAGVGIIGKGLAEAPETDVAYLRENFIKEYIEFWNHGWTHWSHPEHYNTPDTYEFKGRPCAEQYSALLNTQKIIQKRLNRQCRTFGEPHNRFDQNTCNALHQLPEMKVWLGWNNQLSSKKFILNINSYLEEGWPGRIHFVNFFDDN